jgi:hypothetical protein
MKKKTCKKSKSNIEKSLAGEYSNEHYRIVRENLLEQAQQQQRLNKLYDYFMGMMRLLKKERCEDNNCYGSYHKLQKRKLK